MLETLSLAIVDVETSGPSVTGDRVIEVAVQRVEQGRLVRTFSTLIDPEQRISWDIQRLTGITNDDLIGAPTFAAIQDELRAIFDGCVFVAHNVRFDYGFIRNEFERLGRTFEAPCLCTVRLSRLLYPRHRRHGLSALIERFKLACPNRHRALDDAAAVWSFLQIVRESIDPSKISRAVDMLMKTPSLPPGLDEDALKRLPTGPGVYIFYDGDGTTLYVGKSRNVRTRVRSHFSGDHRSGREMRLCQQVARIEARATYGELAALLLESHLIKTMMPMYNQLSRQRRELVVARRSGTPGGYASLRLERIATGHDVPHGDILAVFRSLAQGKSVLRELARDHELCPRVLGLETSMGSCIYRQMKMCRGACVKIEPPDEFNARFDLAFQNRRVRIWPFDGPVMIEEANSDRTEGHFFIVDDWRLCMAARYGEEGISPFLEATHGFDHDAYKILSAHLVRNSRSVRPLSPAELTRLRQAAGCDESA
jgi:DNA polymerase III subunit epsilon